MAIKISEHAIFRIIFLITLFFFIAALYSEEVNPGKINSSILNPLGLNSTENEANGLKLFVNLDSQIEAKNEEGSARYYELTYDNENKVLKCRISSKTGSTGYDWEIMKGDNPGDYIVKGYRSGIVTFNIERKPVKLEYDKKRDDETVEDIFIDQGKYYIPDKIMKPGDEWEYSFFDTTYFPRHKYDKPKYYKIEVKAVFKLAGYMDFEKTRVAVITSRISIRKVYVLLYRRKMLKVDGGTLIYDITSVNQLLLDYNTGSPLYCTTAVTKKVKGTLHDSWGDTPEEAEENVIRDYGGYVNANPNETDFTVYYIKYLHKSKNIVKPTDE